MPLDDDLRHQLQRERHQLGAVTRPEAVLDQLRPDMIRARRLRRLTHAGAAGLLVAGGFVVAQIGSRPDHGSLDIVPAYEPGENTAATPEPISTSDSSDPTPMPPPAAADAADGTVNDGIATGVVAPVVEPQVATPNGSADGDSDDDDGTALPEPGGAAQPTSTVATGSGVAPTSTVGEGQHDDDHDGEGDPVDDDHDDASHDGEGDHGSDDGEGDHGSDDGGHTTTTVHHESNEPTRFDSRCGSVIADVSREHPEIVEILPGPGYAAVVEDEDHGSVTVHFEGGGEDCELKVS